VIYAVRRRPCGPQTVWRLEDGPRPRRWPLADLRSLRIETPPKSRALTGRIARLGFPRHGLSLGSHSFGAGFSVLDQTADFTTFVRALCAEAAVRAPRARFEAGGARIAGIFAGAVAIFTVGLVVVVLATVTAGAYTLGLELGARLAFVLILLVAAWPWLSRLDRRGFDPLNAPHELLP
jgi:hypothetical protein